MPFFNRIASYQAVSVPPPAILVNFHFFDDKTKTIQQNRPDTYTEVVQARADRALAYERNPANWLDDSKLAPTQVCKPNQDENIEIVKSAKFLANMPELPEPIFYAVGEFVGAVLGGTLGCSSQPEDNETYHRPYRPYNDCDRDGDGWESRSRCGGDDCADGNPNIHPSVYDAPRDGVDKDCDFAYYNEDMDGDGYTIDEGDCDDYNARFTPRNYYGHDGDCYPNTPESEPPPHPEPRCTPNGNTHEICQDNAVYSVDSCDRNPVLVEECLPGGVEKCYEHGDSAYCDFPLQYFSRCDPDIEPNGQCPGYSDCAQLPDCEGNDDYFCIQSCYEDDACRPYNLMCDSWAGTSLCTYFDGWLSDACNQ